MNIGERLSWCLQIERGRSGGAPGELRKSYPIQSKFKIQFTWEHGRRRGPNGCPCKDWRVSHIQPSVHFSSIRILNHPQNCPWSGNNLGSKSTAWGGHNSLMANSTWPKPPLFSSKRKPEALESLWWRHWTKSRRPPMYCFVGKSLLFFPHGSLFMVQFSQNRSRTRLKVPKGFWEVFGRVLEGSGRF